MQGWHVNLCYNLRVMKILAISCLVALSVLMALAATGCQQVDAAIIDDIDIMKASPGEPPPTSGWSMHRSGPHPDDVQAVFKPGEKMIVGLVIKDWLLKKEITFVVFSYYNGGTGVEEEIRASPRNLGPWERGSVILVGYPELWDVPAEKGEYELRVYTDDGIAASALFNVGVWPESWGPEIEYFPAPIHEVRVIIEEPHPPPDPWVFVYIKGGLPDSCTEYSGGNCQCIDNTVNITIAVKRTRGAICAQVYGYFEKYWAIGGDRYVPGETYTVNVNDYATSFVMP